jgi:RecB family exonuclease
MSSSSDVIEVRQSSLGKFDLCGERYRRAEVAGEKDLAGSAALRGSGLHWAAQRNHEQKLQTEKDLPKKELADLAAFGVEKKRADEGFRLTPDEETIGSTVVLARTVDAAVRMSDVYAERSAPQIKPHLIEKTISVLLPGGVRLKGTLDLSTIDKRIKDFKTTTRSKSQFDADHSFQFTMYGELYRALTGDQPTGFDMEQFVDLKRGVEYRPLATTRGEADRKVLINRVNMLVGARKAGVYHPAPVGSWQCSPKWCSFWDSCPYVNSERLRAAEAQE